MAVWTLSTTASYNRADGDGPFYLNESQRNRLERIRQGRMLYKGAHAEYFIVQGRTQFDFPLVKAGERHVKLFIPLNLLKLITNKSADLLFGAEPMIRVEDDIQESKLRDLADRTHLHSLLLEAEIEVSFAAETYLAAIRHEDKQVYIIQIPAEQMHPVGPLGPDRQYREYVRYAEWNIGTEQAPVILLLETTYRAGEIERHCYQLDKQQKKEVGLDNWPEFKQSAPATIEKTGIPFNTIVWVPNQLFAGEVISDYDGLIELQDELNSKQTQIARVLAKHSDPKLRVPRSAADGNGNFPAGADVLFADSPDEYGHLTWDAQLVAAIDDRKFTRDALCITAEMSPVLLGFKEGAAPDAAKKLRLEATNSLAKAQRKATLRRPVIKRLLTIAQMLEQTRPGERYDVGSIAVEMRDGLPVDESEDATVISMLRSAKAMSQERAVERQLQDPSAVKKEMERLAAEAAAETPSILMGEPGEMPTPPADEQTLPADTSTEGT